MIKSSDDKSTLLRSKRSSASQSIFSSSSDNASLFFLFLENLGIAGLLYYLRNNYVGFPHCVKSVCIRNISPYSAQCGKVQTRITPNTDTFHAVPILGIEHNDQTMWWQDYQKCMRVEVIDEHIINEGCWCCCITSWAGNLWKKKGWIHWINEVWNITVCMIFQ